MMVLSVISTIWTPPLLRHLRRLRLVLHAEIAKEEPVAGLSLYHRHCAVLAAPKQESQQRRGEAEQEASGC
jgi:hypothetical protein